MTYQEQLKHPEWQKRRLEIMELSNFVCTFCGSKDNQLHVHHLNYIKNHKIWEYVDEDLVCICSECHEKLHFIEDEIKEVTKYFTIEMRYQVLGYIDSIRGKLPRFKNNNNYSKGYIDEIRNNTDELISHYLVD